MSTRMVFLAQAGWFLLVWSVLARSVAWPWSARLGARDRVALWIAPQMFRVLGLGLLVPNLSPGLSPSFAASTAIGDSLTAALAVAAFIALRSPGTPGPRLAAAATLVGAADLAIALPHAAAVDASAHLAAQWYVPVAGVPLMIVSHAGTAAALLRLRRGGEGNHPEG